MRQHGWNVLSCLVLLLCTVAYLPTAASGLDAKQFLKLQEETPCQPWTVEPQDRQGAAHALAHASTCQQSSNLWNLLTTRYVCMLQVQLRH
jgi:hypothetical protein